MLTRLAEFLGDRRNAASLLDRSLRRVLGIRYLAAERLGVDDLLLQQQVAQGDQLIAMITDDLPRPRPLALEQGADLGVDDLARALGQRLVAGEVSHLERAV